MADISLYDKEFPCLEPLGLYAIKTKGAGDCLFHALSDQLYGHQEHHREIRTRVVNRLRQQYDHFKKFIVVAPSRSTRIRVGASSKPETEDYTEEEIRKAFEHRLKRMNNSGEYGDNMEIQAFVQEFNAEVRIYMHQLSYYLQPNKDLPDPEGGIDNRKSVYIAYHNWQHYSSVRNRNGPYTGLPNVVLPSVLNETQEDDEDEAIQEGEEMSEDQDSSWDSTEGLDDMHMDTFEEIVASPKPEDKSCNIAEQDTSWLQVQRIAATLPHHVQPDKILQILEAKGGSFPDTVRYLMEEENSTDSKTDSSTSPEASMSTEPTEHDLPSYEPETTPEQESRIRMESLMNSTPPPENCPRKSPEILDTIVVRQPNFPQDVSQAVSQSVSQSDLSRPNSEEFIFVNPPNNRSETLSDAPVIREHIGTETSVLQKLSNVQKPEMDPTFLACPPEIEKQPAIEPGLCSRRRKTPEGTIIEAEPLVGNLTEEEMEAASRIKRRKTPDGVSDAEDESIPYVPTKDEIMAKLAASKAKPQYAHSSSSSSLTSLSSVPSYLSFEWRWPPKKVAKPKPSTDTPVRRSTRLKQKAQEAKTAVPVPETLLVAPSRPGRPRRQSAIKAKPRPKAKGRAQTGARRRDVGANGRSFDMFAMRELVV